jgi:beta propeller repeat protein
MRRITWKKTLGGAFAGLLFGLIFSVPVLATGYRLNSGGPMVVQDSLVMAGNRIGWSDNRSGTKQIYLKDLAAGGSEARVNATLNNQVSPAISGSIVVWQENSEIFYKNLAGGAAVQLTDNGLTYPKRSPAVYSTGIAATTRIVWSEDHGDRDLLYTKMLSDAGNGTAVDTVDTVFSQTSPTVSAEYIIWQAGDTLTGDTDLRIKKTTSVMYGPADFCTATDTQYNPKVSGNIVAWEDARNPGGASQIYYYDLNLGQPGAPATMGTRLSTTDFDQTRPDVSVNRIVWADWRTGDEDSSVYMKDIVSGVETALVTDVNNQNNPTVSGDKVAFETYRQDETGMGWDVNLMQSDGGMGLTVYSTGFETGSISDTTSGWTNVVDGGVSPAKWGETAHKFHSGTQSIWMAGNGGNLTTYKYDDDMNGLASRTIDLTGFTDGTLSFWYWAKWPVFDNADSIWVQFTTQDNPTVFNDLFHSNSGDPDEGRPFQQWHNITVDLKAVGATGKVIRLYFRGYSDGTQTDDGAYVDDVQITGKTVLPLDHIDISPTSATLQVGGTQAFSATGRDQFGNVISGLSYDWTATGGTIPGGNGSSKIYTAGTVPGTGYYIMVTSGTAPPAEAPITVNPGPLNHIDLTPSSQTLSIGGVQDFTASGQDQYHNVISGLSFTWTATGGTIVPQAPNPPGVTARYTAGTTAGTSFYVRATSGGIFTNAPITVNPDPLDHITVMPGSAAVPVSRTQSFTAQGRDVYENMLSGLTFNWTETGSGSINSSGLYTAPASPGGPYTVTATDPVSGRFDTADVTIIVLSPVHRFYNFIQGVHFYTANQAEATNVNNNLWWTFRYEGVGYQADLTQDFDMVPVYRFYNFLQGVHFYTTSDIEKAYLEGPGGNWTFRYESDAFYAYPPTAPPEVLAGKIPVYRFYNFLQGVHFYTANEAEKNNVINNAGWTFRYEGIAYYLPAQLLP